MISNQSAAATSKPGLGQALARVNVPNCLDVAVLVVDASGTIHFRNHRAMTLLADAPDLESALYGARFLGPFEGWSTELSRVLADGQDIRLECAIAGPDPSVPTLLTIRCLPLTGSATSRVDRAAVLIEECVVPQTSEQQQEISRRLASLGKLAARVAHELNNPLDGILRYINLALRIVGDAPQPKLKSYLAESRTGLMRMVQIIGDLLEYSRVTSGEFDEVGINDLIEEAIRASASAAEENHVVVAADFQTPAMPRVRGSRLYQVCCNLFRNAIDAMPNGGRLTVTSGTVDDEVVIRVADTGVGLPEPIEKVFEPFFTTKPPGKGTGLGLAICKDFIEDMRGTITASPGENGGAVFIVRIPITNLSTKAREPWCEGIMAHPGTGPIIHSGGARGRLTKDQP